MEFVVKVDSKKLMQAIKKAPNAVTKELRKGMEKQMKQVQVLARQDHRFTTKSGQLERSINELTNYIGTKGKVFLDDGVAKYGKYVHEGTKAHDIKPKNKKSLYFVVGGKKVFSKKIHHPGTKEDQFLYRAFNRSKQRIVEGLNFAYVRALKAAGL